MSMSQLCRLYRELETAGSDEAILQRCWLVPFGSGELWEAFDLKSTLNKIYHRLGHRGPEGFGGLPLSLNNRGFVRNNPLGASTELVLSQPGCESQTVERLLSQIVHGANLSDQFFSNMSEECHQFFLNEETMRQKKEQFIHAVNGIRQLQHRLLVQIQARDPAIAQVQLGRNRIFPEHPVLLTAPADPVLEVEMNVLCHLCSVINHPTRDRLRQTHINIARERM